MNEVIDTIGASLFSEILAVDQLARAHIAKVLPQGMELSHFSVLNHLAYVNQERTPAQLAASFHITRGAMTNTLNKLEWMGHIHIRPDWDDARRKLVAISPSGRSARDAALASLTPLLSGIVSEIGEDQARAVVPVLREMRIKLSSAR